MVSLFIIYLYNCLPIKRNKVFLYSYYGSQYGCNPKYISEYMQDHYPKGHFDIVWAFNDLDSKEHLNDIRKVKIMSLAYFYELCTSKIVITNFRTTELYVKRKNQYYIQTWHSSLRLKQIEKDAEENLPEHYINMAIKDSDKCDLLLSGCQFSTNIFKKSFWYDGEIFENGIPRNDIFFKNNEKKRKDILEKIDIRNKKKILLYAPTFRKENNLDVYNLDYSLISEKLKEKFGGEWNVIVKLHPHLMNNSNQLVYGENVHDVTSYDDIQELLFITDVLVTDYSSLMFDFILTSRPCFLYVPDIEEYTSSDRKLYFDIKELPFISVTTNEGFVKAIENFQIDKYNRNVDSFLEQIGSFENGKASERLLTRIHEICFDNKRSEINEAV